MPEPPDTVQPEITDERRLAALESAAAMYKSLDIASPEEQNERMAQYFAGRAEFEASGASATSAWARFTDGQLVIMENEERAYPDEPNPSIRSAETAPNVVGNDPPEIPDLAASSGRARLDAAGVADVTDTGQETMPYGVPGTNLAYLGGYGTVQWMVEVKKWLTKYNYDVHDFDATVENFRNLPTCAVLAVDAHGSYCGGPYEDQVYGIRTMTEVTEDTIHNYRDDLASGRLVYYYHYGKYKDPLRFAITAKFVAAYWTFDHNAFVYLSICRGFNEGLRQAILNPGGGKQGASVYASWTLRGPGPDNSVASLYLFDRLLGANAGSWEGWFGGKLWQAMQEEPAQRPFDWQALKEDMRSSKELYCWDAKYQGISVIEFDNSGPGDFGLLRPSICRVEVHEAEPFMRRLTIEGLFGLPPYRSRKVTIGGDELAIDESLSGISRIVCPDLPSSASGDVVVVINGFESNRVPLTCWCADATFQVEGPGKLKATVKVNIRLRGDVHDFRTKPGKPPEQFRKQIWRVEQHVTVASYNAEGTFSDPDFDFWWSPAQMANFADSVCFCSAVNYMFAPDGNPMTMLLEMQMRVPYKQRMRDRDTGYESVCETSITSAEEFFFGTSGCFPVVFTGPYDIPGSGELKKKQISTGTRSTAAGALHLNGRRSRRIFRRLAKTTSQFRPSGAILNTAARGLDRSRCGSAVPAGEDWRARRCESRQRR